jgi:hypothetical protein
LLKVVAPEVLRGGRASQAVGQGARQQASYTTVIVRKRRLADLNLRQRARLDKGREIVSELVEKDHLELPLDAVTWNLPRPNLVDLLSTYRDT